MATARLLPPTEDLFDEALLAHRAIISAERPSLPHQAGRSLVKLEAAAANWAVTRQARVRTAALAGGKKHRERGTIKVLAVVRPRPDIHKLARAMLRLCEQLAQEQADKEEQDHSA